MTPLGRSHGRRPVFAAISHWLMLMLAIALAAGCEEPFEPVEQNENAAFSIFGYLDLRADTQWIRVMPIRKKLLLEPEPIDATVTLEHLESGRVVTLRDSLFAFTDPRLQGVAYAYNFWTTEPLQPGGSYRLRAARSDGATTTASVEMPADLELTFETGPGVGYDHARLRVRAEHVLFVDVIYALSTTEGVPAEPLVIREDGRFPGDEPGLHGIAVDGFKVDPAGFKDVCRQEIRLAVGPADWPFQPELSDIEVALPGTMPSNVENGLGFLGGLATWTIPFHRCESVLERRNGLPYCTTSFSSHSASIEGRMVREPCGDPHSLQQVQLTERFAEGGAFIRSWRTGWDGRYRFEGIEPGSELVLDPGTGASVIPLPRLSPGERYRLDDIVVPGGC